MWSLYLDLDKYTLTENRIRATFRECMVPITFFLLENVSSMKMSSDIGDHQVQTCLSHEFWITLGHNNLVKKRWVEKKFNLRLFSEFVSIAGMYCASLYYCSYAKIVILWEWLERLQKYKINNFSKVGKKIKSQQETELLLISRAITQNL